MNFMAQVPAVTYPQFLYAVAILGGVVFLVKFGAFVGVVVNAVQKDIPKMFADMQTQMERLAQAVENIDQRLSRLEKSHG